MGIVRLECHQCGSPRCALDGEERDQTWIRCLDCRAHIITFGQLQDEIARQARDYATKTIRRSLSVGHQDNDVAGKC
jgi:hypothetical protein